MRTFRQSFSIALLSSITSLGCGSSEPAADSPAVTTAPAPVVKSSSSGDPYEVCVATFERQRACTDTFIPTLVEARVKEDAPAGIAAKDREGGRDALVAAAHEEWKADSTDDAIAGTCKKIVEGAPADMTSAAQACLEQSECQGFSTCAVDIAASHWR